MRQEKAERERGRGRLGFDNVCIGACWTPPWPPTVREAPHGDEWPPLQRHSHCSFMNARKIMEHIVNKS